MNEEQQRDLYSTFHRFQRSREKTYAPKINKALKEQVNTFIHYKRKGESDAVAFNHITSQGLYDTLKPLYLDAGITYGAKVIANLRKQKARMPIGFNEQMTELLNQYFKLDLLNGVEDITAYTRELIRNFLIEGYPLGWSFDEIVNRLQSADFTSARARLIARTETVTASNTGAHLAAKTTGLKLNKIWIAATDNRTRRSPRNHFDHLHMNGVIVGYDEYFKVSGENLLHPGDRKHNASAGNICNCRCTVGHIPLRDSNGKLVMQ